MLKIENDTIVGWEPTIRGMRNPMNSWEKSDSSYHEDCHDDCAACESYTDMGCPIDKFIVGPNDHDLMMRLAKGGPVHAKYRRMITVYLDITAPLYWWKEFDTYKVGTVANSCSTMHKIHAKEFTLEDFSYEHVESLDVCFDEDGHASPYHFRTVLDHTIIALNHAREMYLRTKTKPMKEESKRAEVMKRYWWQMIQLLPSSYNQKRTIMLNYEVLHGIYHSRRHHKLDEWHAFCDWIEKLPYSEFITEA